MGGVPAKNHDPLSSRAIQGLAAGSIHCARQTLHSRARKAQKPLPSSVPVEVQIFEAPALHAALNENQDVQLNFSFTRTMNRFLLLRDNQNSNVIECPVILFGASGSPNPTQGRWCWLVGFN